MSTDVFVDGERVGLGTKLTGVIERRGAQSDTFTPLPRLSQPYIACDEFKRNETAGSRRVARLPSLNPPKDSLLWRAPLVGGGAFYCRSSTLLAYSIN